MERIELNDQIEVIQREDQLRFPLSSPGKILNHEERKWKEKRITEGTSSRVESGEKGK